MRQDAYQRDPRIAQLRNAGQAALSLGIRGLYRRAERDRRRRLQDLARVHEHEAFPVLAPPATVVEGPFLVGSLPAGQPVRLASTCLNGLTLVYGDTGTGKTSLVSRWITSAIEHDLWTLFIDTKTGENEILQHPAPMLNVDEAAQSLAPPPGCDELAWLVAMLITLETTLWLVSGSQEIIEAYRRVRAVAAEEICFAQLGHHLEQSVRSTKRWSKSLQHQESALAALRRLNGDGTLFAAAQMLPWERRFKFSHGVRIRDATPEAIRTFALIMLAAFRKHAEAQEWTQRLLRALLVFDDARVIVKDLGRSGHAAVDPMIDAIDKMHASGIGVVVNVQHLSELPKSLIVSARNLILVGQVAGDDARQLQARLQLTPKQKDYLMHQPDYCAVCHLRRHAFSYPFPVTLAPPDCALSIAEARTRQEATKRKMLDGFAPRLWQPPLEVTPPAQRPAPTPTAGDPGELSQEEAKPPAESAGDGLEQAAFALLQSVLTQPHLLQVEHGRCAGIEGRELTAIRDRLVDQDLLRVQRCGRYVLLEPTAAAAKTLGTKLEPLTGRGDYPHRWLQARLASWLEADHPRVEMEYATKLGHFDVYAETATGDRVAGEVVLSMDTLDRALEKLAAFNGRCILVVMDTAAAKQVQKVVGEGALWSREHAVEVMTVAQLIKATKDAGTD